MMKKKTNQPVKNTLQKTMITKTDWFSIKITAKNKKQKTITNARKEIKATREQIDCSPAQNKTDKDDEC